MTAATMTPTSPRAFLLSVSLHLTAVLLALFFGYATARRDPEMPKVIELVAGEGDNFAAREAPALGVEGGVKLTMPAPATPKATPLPPIEPAPVAPAPPPPKATPAPKATPTAPAPDAVPNFKKKILYDVVRGDAKAKLQIRREREAEAKRLAEEKKRLTKEEFDRAQKAKAAPAGKTPPVKVARIDGEGIAKGVVGGSVDNKIGGAGGKALKSDNDDVLGAYYAMFKQRVRVEFEPPPGLSDSLQAKVQVRSNPDGSLASPRILRTSGSRIFDNAVLEAIKRVKMPPRPDNKPESFDFDFTMRPPEGASSD